MEHSTILSSRRHFIKSAAALGLPLILPGRLLGDNAPSNRVTLAFIGVGKMGGGHVNSFIRRDDVQIVAVCDVDANRREHWKNHINKHYADQNETSFKGCEAYNDFRELLERKDIDAVVISTPDHWHAFIASAAAQAGKDVYCEKPLTYNIEEAVKLVQAIRKTDRVFQTGSQQRSSKEFRVAAELVRNGIIGNLQTITTSFGDPATPWNNATEDAEPALDWDLWCGPGPKIGYHTSMAPRGVHDNFPMGWRMCREFGGGMITDWGAHHIDIAQWALGVDGSGPVEVRPPENWETAKRGAQLVYENGVVLTHNDGKGLSLYGDEGEIHVSRGRFELILNGETKHKSWGDETPGVNLGQEVDKAEETYLAKAETRLYASDNHHTDWINAIRERKRPVCDVEIGASSVIACHLMNFGYYYGANVKWDPKNHTILEGGDNKWLARQDGRGDWTI